MTSANITGGSGADGPSGSYGGPPTPNPETQAFNDQVAKAMETNKSSRDIDMADQQLRSLDDEPAQIASSSPPFPRYTGYNEVATGTTTGSVHAEPKPGLATVKAQGPQPASLPARPAPVKCSRSSRFAGPQVVVRADSGTAEWSHSPAGRKFLAKHQLQLPPTQLLSLECQKRRFNPCFKIEQEDSHVYTCSVTMRDDVVRIKGHYQNAVAAKQHVAFEALKVVQAWPLPGANLYFIAQFSGQISDDMVHNKLYHVLHGRQYTLYTLRYPRMPGGFLLLQIPEDQGYPTSFIRLSGGLDSVVFANIKKTDHCNLCPKTPGMTPHSRICCALWRESPAPGSHKHGFPQNPVKTEQRSHGPPANHNTGIGKHARGYVDQRDQLIRSIQDVVGTAPTGSQSNDPRVKTAFLEGIALGARIAMAAPGPETNTNRRRSRSPGVREPRPAADYWPPPGYRARSPLATTRDRQMSREPMVDRGVAPRQASYGAVDSYRRRRRSSDSHVGQGASYWVHDMYSR
ncbi:hypothetical protein NKR19_g4702 [Coniochaeta hoffmannii]|uniref:Uncharacterized protein n=1 Tax=Coniochaeta hoffmannii TaxID=91930 RepID=A0AA38VHV0_9PEZI|nr:hypothetical protein NKR19_g4702 [Coniochaeta hoffmannii]